MTRFNISCWLHQPTRQGLHLPIRGKRKHTERSPMVCSIWSWEWERAENIQLQKTQVSTTELIGKMPSFLQWQHASLAFSLHPASDFLSCVLWKWFLTSQHSPSHFKWTCLCSPNNANLIWSSLVTYLADWPTEAHLSTPLFDFCLYSVSNSSSFFLIWPFPCCWAFKIVINLLIYKYEK